MYSQKNKKNNNSNNKERSFGSLCVCVVGVMTRQQQQREEHQHKGVGGRQTNRIFFASSDGVLVCVLRGKEEGGKLFFGVGYISLMVLINCV
jgi:hypothetical protein